MARISLFNMIRRLPYKDYEAYEDLRSLPSVDLLYLRVGAVFRGRGRWKLARFHLSYSNVEKAPGTILTTKEISGINKNSFDRVNSLRLCLVMATSEFQILRNRFHFWIRFY